MDANPGSFAPDPYDDSDWGPIGGILATLLALVILLLV